MGLHWPDMHGCSEITHHQAPDISPSAEPEEGACYLLHMVSCRIVSPPELNLYLLIDQVGLKLAVQSRLRLKPVTQIRSHGS